MAQVRVPVLSNPGPSFLSLPYSLRRRIYILAGLVRFCPIDLNHEGPQKAQYLQKCVDDLGQIVPDWRPWAESHRAVVSLEDTIAGFCCFYRGKRFEGRATFPGPDGIDCICGPLPSGLLLVSRAIHAEVTTILYSENRFKICRTGPGGLTALSQISAPALRVMTSLHIRLNACGCVPSHICSITDRLWEDPFFLPCRSCHPGCKCGGDLPLSPGDPDAATLVREWEGLTKRLAQLLPPRRLRLSLVCDTLDCAMALQILEPVQKLPLLAECAIRLDQRPDHRVRLLAETAVRHVIGQPRIRDESFPWGDLPPELQSRILRYSGLLAPGPITWAEGDGLGWPSCCRQCTDALETCCCPRLHAAFTSMRCTCWSWPRDHFLVSKGFRKQALQAVYTSNVFSVHTCHAQCERDEEGCYEHRSALTFLQSLPWDALPYVRALRIVFTSFTRYDLQIGTRSLANWEATVAFIRQHITLARLDLTLCLQHALEDDGYNTGSEDLEWQFYQRMIEPATILRGVQNLSVIFPPVDDSARVARNRERERELQMKVMGPAYNQPTTIRVGQGHPATDSAGESRTVYLGPSGEQVWPIP